MDRTEVAPGLGTQTKDERSALRTEWFTWASFATVGGCAAFIMLAAGALSKAFGEWAYPNWFPLLLSTLLAVGVDVKAKGWGKWKERILLWLANGALVYATAVGIQAQFLPTDQARVSRHAMTAAEEAEPVQSPAAVDGT